MKKYIQISLFFSAIFILSDNSFAQQDSISYALEATQQKNYTRAYSAIEAATLHPSTAGDYQAWSLKAYILKELSKKQQGVEAIELRYKSLESVKTSIQLNKTRENFSQDSSLIDHLSRKFYNDAVSNLNSSGYNSAIRYFETYEECVRIINPAAAANLKIREMDFKLALANVYTSIYESNRKQNESFFEKTISLYNEILNNDPDNISANYSIGVLYYNKAVAIINEMDFETDLIALSETQDKTIEIFKKSLPFMEKAYQLNPKRKETLQGLEGIYYSLNENEKYDKIKQELIELEK
jgi:hypothetical protein